MGFWKGAAVCKAGGDHRRADAGQPVPRDDGHVAVEEPHEHGPRRSDRGSQPAGGPALPLRPRPARHAASLISQVGLTAVWGCWALQLSALSSVTAVWAVVLDSCLG